MGIASIVLGALSLLCAVGGALTTPVPGLGMLLSFASPVLALIGIVLGGVGLSRGREEGTETMTATAGLIVSVIAFIPAFFVAISCGVCNALCTQDMLRGPQVTPWIVDSGPSRWAAPLLDAGPSVPIEPNAPPPPPEPAPPAPAP